MGLGFPRYRRCLPSALLWAIGLLSPPGIRADRFTYVNEDGQTETVEARLAGSGQDRQALELATGRLVVVSQSKIKKREIADGPEPVDVAGMIAELRIEFGEEKLRTMPSGNSIAAVVLADALAPAQEVKVRAYLRTAASFLSNVDKVFANYARLMRIELEKPRFPLVMLIFESDQDFEQYAADVTGNRGISAGNIAGFYSAITNWLAMRMGECFTFEVPLHEAIHQQVFNRGVFQRLAPIPVWFNEGIATAFENEGDKIAGNPAQVNLRYARLAQVAKRVSWEDLIREDSAFRGDVLAGEAYVHGWCLHWMLATGHTDQYRKYVRMLQPLEPLVEVSSEDRLRQFEEIFQKPVDDLQQDFPRQLGLAAKRQKVSIEPPPPPGQSVTQTGPAEVKLEAVSRLDSGGVMQVRGTIKNRSPFRDWMLYVVVETDGGLYTDWLLPKVKSGQSTPLAPQFATKATRGSRTTFATSYRVRVRTALPGSEEAKNWEAGQLPKLAD